MLGVWRSHEQFQLWLEEKLLAFLPEHKKLIRFYANILEKVYIPDLDRLHPLVLDRYSHTGRPAKNQPEIFQALVVMIHLQEGITSFVKSLGSGTESFCLFTRTRRGSKAWKRAFVRRTTIERTIKRILVYYNIESLSFRAQKRWLWLASLVSINMHLDAQMAVLKLPLFTKLGLTPVAA